MKLIISSVSGEPIYQQIEDQIRSAVLDGSLRAGESLPSLRSLAKDLRISVLTVTRAYNELAQEGILENIQGKGTFVLDRSNERMHERLVKQVRSDLDNAAQAARAAGIGGDDLHDLLDQAMAQLDS
ncbi:transcriptional regulator, GntR family [Bifidobacterium actinocoloniiforme DSM 22766]|uniref:Transcriptional regulator, GntR family n=1 Tax=Bifidobacterium actinocoloniiforme DSM 22766 TaxID=1437605 RepID=A0A086Z0N6_9BIFI|nr:GntR family transcriptional regulator [Bifidobacterium actinocoloniiforme]AKV55295.1 GntR family transcriptional regulator [Bifidobacterium actinocoloniiforme DSM 22766]KFI40086.1 transcriptional regulator, GntR family [Bifidobacterium actinocoloniiforme DSM 22766]